MNCFWSKLKSLLYVLFIVSVMFVLFIVASAQEAAKTVQSPDRSYGLRLPAGWEAETVKDGLGREQMVIFFEIPNKAKLEIRKLPTHALTSAQTLAEHDEMQYVRFRRGYVKGGLTTLKEWKAEAEVALLAYSFIEDGKTIFGRNYYVRLAGNHAYLLRFILTPEVLHSQQAQLPLIVQSFRLLPAAALAF